MSVPRTPFAMAGADLRPPLVGTAALVELAHRFAVVATVSQIAGERAGAAPNT